tara:strand:+ start:445 stop:570 length:126 start_codon:yes stop_codon:yes gene_type:complete
MQHTHHADSDNKEAKRSELKAIQEDLKLDKYYEQLEEQDYE